MSTMEKSDSPEVAAKQVNKAALAAAESVERRGGAKENADQQSTVRTQSRAAVSNAQTRIRDAVTRNRQGKLTALLHHISIDVLRASFFDLKRSAAPGVDEMTWADYVENIEANLADLHRRVHTGAYRALPSRRTYIPKADGRQRPLGIAGLEDKIVQSAVVAILTPIYEAEFLGFSYGFRPGRNQHQALDALAFGIGKRQINWVLDCDVQSFFDKVSQDWLIRFVEHRIGDRRIIRLITKWLKAGVLEDGRLVVTEEGTPQGAVISPLLANIWRAIARRRSLGLGKPETFNFLGFTHYCATRRNRNGFVLGRKPIRKRMQVKLREIKERLQAMRHDGIERQGKWLAQVLRGWLAYYAVPMSAPAITAFRHHMIERWRSVLLRRSQRARRLTWDRMKGIAERYLPYPRILHPWPEQRFLVTIQGKSPVR